MSDTLTGPIFDIKRFALHDGPGIRTTAFFKGCPLRCLWCQNPEGLSHRRALWYHQQRCIRCGACLAACPNNVLTAHPDETSFIHVDRDTCDLSGACVDVCPSTALEFDSRDYNPEELLEVFLRDEVFYGTSGGGVTLSGGEPLAQPKFAVKVLELCRGAGLNTAIETTLHVPRSTVESVVGLVDHFLTDVKLMDVESHRRYTGVDNARIHGNLAWLAEQDVDITVRLPLIPGVTATDQNVSAVARFVKGLPGDRPLELINFNPLASGKYLALDMPYAFVSVTAPLDPDVVSSLADTARNEGVKVV